MNYGIYEHKTIEMAADRHLSLVPIGIPTIPTICLYNFEPNLINILSKR